MWSLPDRASGRIQPELHAAYHGLVYAQTPRGEVILDAQSGVDKVTNVSIAPDVVVAGYGLVKKDYQLYAYAAIG